MALLIRGAGPGYVLAASRRAIAVPSYLSLSTGSGSAASFKARLAWVKHAWYPDGGSASLITIVVTKSRRRLLTITSRDPRMVSEASNPNRVDSALVHARNFPPQYSQVSNLSSKTSRKVIPASAVGFSGCWIPSLIDSAFSTSLPHRAQRLELYGSWIDRKVTPQRTRE
jgi:hypothetical protein